MAQERARNEWDARIAHAAVERGRARSRETDLPQEPAIGTPVARLVIPKISLDDIVFEGVSDAALNGGPGHLPGSVSPGRRIEIATSGGSASFKLATLSRHIQNRIQRSGALPAERSLPAARLLYAESPSQS